MNWNLGGKLANKVLFWY